MTVETASYISQFDTTLPTASDPKSEGDNHLRLLKTVLKNQFPNFGTAAMNASHTELNYMVGVTSAVQTQLNTLTSTKAAKAGDTYTGTHSFAGATSVTVPTATAGDNSTTAASTAFVAATAFSSALPAQTGNNGKILSTNGTTASWTDTFTTSKSITGNLTFSGAGRRMAADLESFTRADRFLFTNSGSSGQASLGVIPSAAGGIGAYYEAFGGIDPDNCSSTSLFSNQFASRAGVNSGKLGTGTTLPLCFSIDGTDALQIDTSRNIRSIGGGALGYGAGSGGAVTQLTSKTTSVTLNKPCGQVTMNAAALAGGAVARFLVSNSVVSAMDIVVVAIRFPGSGQYRCWVSQISNGSFDIDVQNNTAGSLSDAVVVTFSVIKGATS